MHSNLEARSGSGEGLGWPLERAARLYADSEAVIDGDQAVTYGDLLTRTRALGTALQNFGVPLAGRVGFLGTNSLAHLECWLGVPAHGFVLVDLNFRLAEAELAFIVDDCQIELLVTDADQVEVARRLRDRCPTLRELVFAGGPDCPADCSP